MLENLYIFKCDRCNKEERVKIKTSSHTGYFDIIKNSFSSLEYRIWQGHLCKNCGKELEQSINKFIKGK